MELNEARKRFETIANKTGILSNPIIVEPNKKERDELWDITRSFLKRIYALDIQEGYSEEVYNEYNQLCHWAIVALHWNDLMLSDKGFSFDNGRFRRDTIALAICLYTRLSSRYKYFNTIKRGGIMPHAFGSILLWTLRSITDCNTDNFFTKFDPETTKEALKDYQILFKKYGYYHVEEDDYDNKDLEEIFNEIYDRFNSVRKPYHFVLNYIWMGSDLPGGMGLLSEDRDMNKAFLQKMIKHNQFPDDWSIHKDLAYVSIYLAKTTDDDLAKSEENQILSNLSRDIGGKDEDKGARALSCYNNAMELFSIDESDERFLCVLTNINSFIEETEEGDKGKINKMLTSILKDLAQVAWADEELNANEFYLIEWIRQSWKIDIKLFNDDIYEIYENDKLDSKEEVIEEESVSKEESEFLTDYPGDLYCKNERWDSELGQIYKLRIQPFPNVFEDGEYKYEDLFRRFTHEEVNMIVEKIKSTGTLIYLPFVHRILSKKFDIRGLKIPFWFDPFIISGALNGAGGIFYFEQNGFFANTYENSGAWIEPTALKMIMHVDMMVDLDHEAGYNGYWNEYISGDEDRVTTIDINYENPASGNGGELSLIQTNGTEYASTLPIVEAIWDHSWSKVVEASKETSVFVLPTNCEYFDSWDDLLNWARSKENSQNSKGRSEEEIIVEEDDSIEISPEEALLEQVSCKDKDKTDEVIFNVITYFENNKMTSSERIALTKKILEINNDAQLAAEIAGLLISFGQSDFAFSLIETKDIYSGDDWSYEAFDKIKNQLTKEKKSENSKDETVATGRSFKLEPSGGLLTDLFGTEELVPKANQFKELLKHKGQIPFLHFDGENDFENKLFVIKSNGEKATFKQIYEELDYKMNRGPIFYFSECVVNYTFKTFIIFVQDGWILEDPNNKGAIVLYPWEVWGDVLFTKHKDIDAPVILMAYPTEVNASELSISPKLDLKTNVVLFPSEEVTSKYTNELEVTMSFAFSIIKRYWQVVEDNRGKSTNSIPLEMLYYLNEQTINSLDGELQVKSAVGNKSMLPFAELFKAEKNIEALDSIFEKSHSLWIENLNKISKVNYIMFCEAPPFDESGSVSNYIYDRNGEAKGMYLKAPYKALKGKVETYPPKAEMIDFLNEKGFLFLDVLPLSISFSPKRNTKQYRDFVKYFWNGNGADLDFSEFIVQNRLNEIKDKISDDLRVCFALKSISLVVNSLDNSNLKFGDKTIHISDKLVGLNTAGQPGVTEITNAFKSSVLK